MTRSALLLAPSLILLAGCSGGEHRKGAWFGDLQLCRDTVKRAGVMANRKTNAVNLMVELQPGSAEQFRKITANLNGKHLPLTLHGVLLTEPTVDGEISGGMFKLPVLASANNAPIAEESLYGIKEGEAWDLVDATKAPCG